MCEGQTHSMEYQLYLRGMNDKLFPNMDYELFLRCLTEERDGIDETEILFLDDPGRGACIMGYIPHDCGEEEDRPYWIGSGCDVKGGAEFASPEALLNAPVYGGRSIAGAWKQVCVLHLGMVPLDIWFKACSFADEVVEEDGVWKLRKISEAPARGMRG